MPNADKKVTLNLVRDTRRIPSEVLDSHTMVSFIRGMGAWETFLSNMYAQSDFAESLHEVKREIEATLRRHGLVMLVTRKHTSNDFNMELQVGRSVDFPKGVKAGTEADMYITQHLYNDFAYMRWGLVPSDDGKLRSVSVGVFRFTDPIPGKFEIKRDDGVAAQVREINSGKVPFKDILFYEDGKIQVGPTPN